MTKAELKERVEDIFPDANQVNIFLTPKTVSIQIAAMYQSPGRSLSRLIQLSEIMGTIEIDDEGQFGRPWLRYM